MYGGSKTRREERPQRNLDETEERQLGRRIVPRPGTCDLEEIGIGKTEGKIQINELSLKKDFWTGGKPRRTDFSRSKGER